MALPNKTPSVSRERTPTGMLAPMHGAASVEAEIVRTTINGDVRGERNPLGSMPLDSTMTIQVGAAGSDLSTSSWCRLIQLAAWNSSWCRLIQLAVLYSGWCRLIQSAFRKLSTIITSRRLGDASLSRLLPSATSSNTQSLAHKIASNFHNLQTSATFNTRSLSHYLSTLLTKSTSSFSIKQCILHQAFIQSRDASGSTFAYRKKTSEHIVPAEVFKREVRTSFWPAKHKFGDNHFRLLPGLSHSISAATIHSWLAGRFKSRNQNHFRSTLATSFWNSKFNRRCVLKWADSHLTFVAYSALLIALSRDSHLSHFRQCIARLSIARLSTQSMLSNLTVLRTRLMFEESSHLVSLALQLCMSWRLCMICIIWPAVSLAFIVLCLEEDMGRVYMGNRAYG